MSIYDFSQYFPQSGLLSQPDFTQQQGLLARMDPWTSEYQQAAGTPGLFGHQTPELPTWQQQASFLPDWDKMFGAADGNGNGNGNGAIPGSDKDKDLQAGRTHHPGMYDADDMWVGAEGGGQSEANWSGGGANPSGAGAGGVPWQDSPFAGLIGKLGINPAGYANVEPTQDDINAAVAAANAAPMGALERQIAQAEAAQAQAEAEHDFGNQGIEESAGGGWTVG